MTGTWFIPLRDSESIQSITFFAELFSPNNKPGRCPYLRDDDKTRMRHLLSPSCSQDSNCSGYNKCCDVHFPVKKCVRAREVPV